MRCARQPSNARIQRRADTQLSMKTMLCGESAAMSCPMKGDVKGTPPLQLADSLACQPAP